MITLLTDGGGRSLFVKDPRCHITVILTFPERSA